MQAVGAVESSGVGLLARFTGQAVFVGANEHHPARYQLRDGPAAQPRRLAVVVPEAAFYGAYVEAKGDRDGHRLTGRAGRRCTRSSGL